MAKAGKVKLPGKKAPNPAKKLSARLAKKVKAY